MPTFFRNKMFMLGEMFQNLLYFWLPKTSYYSYFMILFTYALMIYFILIYTGEKMYNKSSESGTDFIYTRGVTNFFWKF